MDITNNKLFDRYICKLHFGMLNRISKADGLRDGQHLPRKARAKKLAIEEVSKKEIEQPRRGVVQTARTEV